MVEQESPGRYDVGLAAHAPRAPWPPGTAFERWRDAQGIPVHRGFAIEDIAQLDTERWDLVGCEAAFLDLDGAIDSTGQHVLRLQAGSSTRWRRQLFEELVYVVEGAGRLEVRRDGDLLGRGFAAGALMPLPLNLAFRVTALEPVVLYCVNAAPLVMNLFHDDGFVFDNDYAFFDRLPEGELALSSLGRLWRKPRGESHVWETQFVEDVRAIELPLRPDRGAGGGILLFQFGECTLTAHVSEFPPRSYKKAHRHGPGANVLILTGRGYSLLWPDTFADRVRVDWRANSVVVPPAQWWHQHFNADAEPARYLAMRWNSPKHPLDHHFEGTGVDRRQGGNQIEYDDQDPEVGALFAAEAAARDGLGLAERA